jgi:hypothetical protein
MRHYGDEVVYEYKGYKYKPDDDVEEDNVKRFHDVITPTGERTYIPFSPYSTPSRTSFERWIDLGMPKRGDVRLKHNGNYKNEDIEFLWEMNASRFINSK